MEVCVAEGETFTSLVLAMIYRLLFNLYRDLVPCFVIARGVSKKLVWTFRFHAPRRVSSTYQIRLPQLRSHTRIFIPSICESNSKVSYIYVPRIPMYLWAAPWVDWGLGLQNTLNYFLRSVENISS